MESHKVKTPQKRRAKPKDGTQLICSICGDGALGYNFDVVTCESCKAFFRRNALSSRTYKCTFQNNCTIDVLSRKFCSSCRLQKCLSLGMKTDYILTERQLQTRRERKTTKLRRLSTEANSHLSSSDTDTETSPQLSEASSHDPMKSPDSSTSPHGITLSSPISRTETTTSQMVCQLSAESLSVSESRIKLESSPDVSPVYQLPPHLSPSTSAQSTVKILEKHKRRGSIKVKSKNVSKTLTASDVSSSFNENLCVTPNVSLTGDIEASHLYPTHTPVSSSLTELSSKSQGNTSTSISMSKSRSNPGSKSGSKSPLSLLSASQSHIAPNLPPPLPANLSAHLPPHLPANLSTHLPANLPPHLTSNLPTHLPPKLPSQTFAHQTRLPQPFSPHPQLPYSSINPLPPPLTSQLPLRHNLAPNSHLPPDLSKNTQLNSNLPPNSQLYPNLQPGNMVNQNLIHHYPDLYTNFHVNLNLSQSSHITPHPASNSSTQPFLPPNLHPHIHTPSNIPPLINLTPNMSPPPLSPVNDLNNSEDIKPEILITVDPAITPSNNPNPNITIAPSCNNPNPKTTIAPEMETEDYNARQPLNEDIAKELTAIYTSYTSIFDVPYSPEQASKLHTNKSSSTDLFNMADMFIRRFVQFAKTIQQFKELSQSDQISLIKGGIMTIMVIRSAMSFSIRQDGWMYKASSLDGDKSPSDTSPSHPKQSPTDGTPSPVDNVSPSPGDNPSPSTPTEKTTQNDVKETVNTSSESGKIGADAVNKVHGFSVFKDHYKFIIRLKQLCDNSPVLLVLLLLMELFAPDRPSIEDKEAISLYQEHVSYMLQCQLRSIYRLPRARRLYPRLLMALVDLRNVGEVNSNLASQLDIEKMEPLLIEVFNMNSIKAEK